MIIKIIDHKYLQEITVKYHSGHRKHKYELVEEPKKQVNKISINGKVAIKVIMNCKRHRLINLEQHYDLNN